MAQFNPSDITYAVIKETTAGTTPTSPAFLSIDYIPGTMPTYTSDFIELPTLRASRASAGKRKLNFKVDGGLKVHFKRDHAVELLLQSAMSGTWTEAGTEGDEDDVLKASNVDTSFTIEKKMSGASSLYQRFTGCQVSSFGLSVQASGNAEASFDVIGMGRSTGTSILSSATYTAGSSNLSLAGLDVTNVAIAGLSVTYRSLDLKVTHNREPKDSFGSTSAFGIGTSGNRAVTLSMEFYREDFTPESVLSNDTPVAVSFDIGTGSEGYTFTLPAATSIVPQDKEDGSKLLVTVEFSAQRDNTALTDFIITRN